MQRHYIKLMRRAYRFLRSPWIRSRPWLNNLIVKLFDRQLWRPTVHTASRGLSVGLFCSMLPIPFQMLLAAASCFYFRGTVPLAVAACWITNPVTQFPVMGLQEKLGAYMRSFCDFGLLSPIDINVKIPIINYTANGANFLVGVLTSATFLAILAFPILFTLFWFLERGKKRLIQRKIKESICHSQAIHYESSMQKIPVHIYDTREAAVEQLACETAELIRKNDLENKPTVLGLATGSTPIAYYKELIKLHQNDGLSFKNVITFNLDEYAGLNREHPESYWHFMHQNLFDHIDIDPKNIHLPSGTAAPEDIPQHCGEYEKAIVNAGGIDLQILGIGRTGHIGFNEPGSPKDSITRAIELDPITRQDAAPAFGGIDNVPTAAITMGCGTILAAHRIVLMAWGTNKAEIVNKAVTGPVNDIVSASYLQEHPNAIFYIDKEAGAELPDA